jgi:predicted dehydrogenase
MESIQPGATSNPHVARLLQSKGLTGFVGFRDVHSRLRFCDSGRHERLFLQMPMNEPRLRIGIIGAGAVSSGSHLPVLVNMPDVTIEWICDQSLPRARTVARSYRIPRAFADLSRCPEVDVVLVATPVGSRNEVIPQVLSRGWHAFCEKPFALTLADHDAYVAEAGRRGVQIGVGQVRRYAKPTVAARKFIERGFLGPILRVAAADGFHMRGTGRSDGWHMADHSAGGGVLAELGSHLIDQVLYALHATDVALRDCKQRVHLGLELASSLTADVTTATGATVECSMEVSLLDDLCNGIFVEFPSYMLRVGLAFEDTLTLVSKEGEPLADFVMHDGADSPVQGFYLEWKDFLRQCRTGERCAIDARTVRQTTALIEAGSRSQGVSVASPNEPLVAAATVECAPRLRA